MTSFEFETITHGKWILAGEHAVLRGHPALVFPVPEKQLILRYTSNHTALSISYTDSDTTPIDSVFWRVIQHGMQLLGKAPDDLFGHFYLESNIPIGSGMGASAALCVAIARWFAFKGLLAPEKNLQNFARELEHLFHGQSSGLDISGVAATSGIYFQQGTQKSIESSWQPIWFLSNCGQTGMTSSCIEAVNTLWQTNPIHANTIDQQMHEAVLDAQIALKVENLTQLTTAINQASDCFQKWGLINNTLKHHMNKLLKAGAIAVKPTGSGGGGYVVSLWKNSPQDLIKKFDLIRI